MFLNPLQRGVGWPSCCPPKGTKPDIIEAILKFQKSNPIPVAATTAQPVPIVQTTVRMERSIERPRPEISDAVMDELTTGVLTSALVSGTANFTSFDLSKFPYTQAMARMAKATRIPWRKTFATT